VGAATIYRTLRLLEESRLAIVHHFPGKGALYEVAFDRDHHDHLICELCGRIIEFTDDEIEQIQLDVARQHGFVLHTHRHELLGRCPECRAVDGIPSARNGSG